MYHNCINLLVSSRYDPNLFSCIIPIYVPFLLLVLFLNFIECTWQPLNEVILIYLIFFLCPLISLANSVNPFPHPHYHSKILLFLMFCAHLFSENPIIPFIPLCKLPLLRSFSCLAYINLPFTNFPYSCVHGSIPTYVCTYFFIFTH